ncbi:hypothetical protein PAXRUDRAFT_730887 [Paxillus rubicundulus Ve08.2h10]|uniref:Uncharacterized protein n=1 Tax=Paxillus rubicundulus Ve08.2h10 TaxID=930991 RepID=A0A0D0DR60_9AGAM|nr:hypothetical protein PAXRUDRAFT_730887 [Paxillus rubicundulus Ve08.2h10]
MPIRVPPKAYQLLLKTHKLTIFLTAPQSSTIETIKDEALSALTSDVLLSSSSGVPRIPTAPGEDLEMSDEQEGGDGEVPRVKSTEDFELCRGVKDKGKSNATSSAPMSYETLDPSNPIKGLLSNWEVLYIQFRDEEGNLMPVNVSHASLLDDEDEDPRRVPAIPELPVAVRKGKRKAPPE